MLSKRKKTIFAAGADIKNRFLLVKGKSMKLGPEIGDLSDAGNYEIFKKETKKAIKKYKPDIIACDLHPGYFSTNFAIHSAQRTAHGARRIQHHHAHIASVISEHGLKGRVIGVCFDGTGFGADGNIWGGEFLLVRKRGFKRLGHLVYHKMPGGDKVIRQPWRMLIGILGREAFPFIKGVRKEDKEFVLAMAEKGINSPLTSAAGRLFDAAAALLGICRKATYEAEGPMKLEAMCKEGIKDAYKFLTLKDSGKNIIDTRALFSGMIKDLKAKKNKRFIATKFHNSMVRIITKTVERLSRDTGLKNIALSGGVFQNKFLKEKTVKELQSLKFRVFTNEKNPVNDFNISLGQYHVLSSTGKN